MSKDTALVIIDIQIGMIDPDNAHHQEALAHMQTLLERARAADVPVIYVQHSGPKGDWLEPGTERWPIHPAIAPQADEVIVHKRASDSFHATTLEQVLQDKQIKHLVVAGAQTDYCVDTTVRRATTFGYNVTLVGDAHLTYTTTILSEAQIIAFYNDTLHGFTTDEATVEVKPTAEVIF
ncbi:cysteine hydrolase family protein [Dictyobacter arantiisoli]|uniref:Isochorismatase n=1 Tax=Dictyobacter arantiisoli TaxID=2014874 RepID=A0A5A5TKT7_9CHLR|nr:cysteine hydrolase family protein [Dictyobacter arantiisoli]GCF11902.1 isochorismatase [Dictyobacter arantiisoli]